ncbi:hypothetical protein F5887DRAFT_1077670 [Amanita rubescens]|nr:hypothetical protein F5887DRAFT_1077670 [Amanita rubescens]
MLDEPQYTRLYTQRAFQGSYNLKDPPRSPTLKYPGPHWVPDNLRAAWCAAETLTRCLSRDTSITYKSARRMLDLVLPDQRDNCEIGIELMLKAGWFTPEREQSSARSSITQNPLKQGTHGSRKRDSPQASRLLDDMLDEFIKRQDELRSELAKTREELKSSFTSCHLSPMPGASVFIREQPQKTVLTEEQQKGSSFSDLKPAKPTFSDSFSEPGKVMAERSPLSPLRPSVLSGPLQSNLGERTRPRVTSVASLRVSATKTQNSAERVQLTRCMAVLSSAKPDHLPAPQGLELSAPRFAREPPSARKSTLTSHNALKSIPEMDSAISWPSPSLSVHAKAQEQSIETVLDRESPKGSPHIDLKLFGPDVSAPAPSTCGIARMPERSPAGKGEVSLEKRMSAVKHSPVAEAAPTPPKSMPVSYIRALPASSSKDGVPLSPRVIPMQRTPIGVNTRRVVNDTTHRQDETPRVFRKPSSPRYETPSPAISERRNLSVVMSTTPKSSSWLSPSRNAISTSRNSTPVSFIPRAPPVNKPNDRIAMSLQMVSMRHAPNIVNTRRMVKVDAHHHDETCSRVSSKAVNPRIGKTPIAGVEGRSNKRSNVNRGPAIKQALMSLVFESPVQSGFLRYFWCNRTETGENRSCSKAGWSCNRLQPVFAQNRLCNTENFEIYIDNILDHQISYVMDIGYVIFQDLTFTTLIQVVEWVDAKMGSWMSLLKLD